jgi:MoaA/NifB/PqqE/SkfB family radical SAM enzyme
MTSHEQNRRMNRELNRLETVFLKPETVSRPIVVQLATGTRCNLRCVFCTHRGPDVDDCYRDLTLEEFIPLTDPLPWASVVQLWGWGEPLCNPDYGRIFSWVTTNFPGIEVNISTNGTLLDEGWCRTLLDYGNISINASINAASAASYRKVAGADLFDRVAENMERFGALIKGWRGGCRISFSTSFVVIRDNLEEMPAFVELSARFGADHVQFMDLMHIPGGSEVVSVRYDAERARDLFAEARELAGRHRISIGSFLPYAEQDYFAMEKYGARATQDDPAPGLIPCYEPWRTLLVGTDGTSTLCCRSGVVTGNVREDGYEGVWNGPVYRDYRSTVNSATPPGICRRCPVKLGMSS